MLCTNEINSANEVREPLVLPKESKLVDCGDDNGWYEAIDVLVRDIDWQPLSSARAGGTLAAVLNKPQFGIVGDRYRTFAERALKDTLILRINPLSHESFVQFV